ncbi:autotransporter outer membrane beta-barrel domain-containing protein [Pseudorhodoplanes sp.]|uniref:autotransporter outer membrane beta-barrel domain-containing protein n=1 Tax=Pseudorhodoplanes sp. TaxID=1934341 RepID=UPI002C79EDBB|nr:autotransporter outer membrane beta-barrel domain-containing protein [Pseudorhodoplanes sp.]HWV51448.1 autotransporter outer membrane beta-barrel domain-containing protein [Pseudorhodoplanes sp.]
MIAGYQDIDSIPPGIFARRTLELHWLAGVSRSPAAAFGKLAWAHDFDTDRTLTPVFQSLGSSFIVNGARPDSDLALVTVGVEARMANGWSATARLGGEFGGDTQTYTAQGKLRYAW